MRHLLIPGLTNVGVSGIPYTKSQLYIRHYSFLLVTVHCKASFLVSLSSLGLIYSCLFKKNICYMLYAYVFYVNQNQSPFLHK